MSSSFRNRVIALVSLSAGFGKPLIGFGLREFDQAITASLKASREWARILIVSAPGVQVEGFEFIATENPEETLASLLATDKVEGIVRGTIDDFKTIEAYERLTHEKYTLLPALFENTAGQQFFLEPVSNPDGWAKEERVRRAIYLAEFVAEWDIKPRIAVYTGVRHDTYARQKNQRAGVTGILNQTYEDAEWILGEFRKRGLEAENWTIELDAAVRAGYNIHVPVNGMVGNQASRGIMAGGGTILAVPRLGLSRFYEDNSRTETNFEFHIQWLVAQINRRKQSSSSGPLT